MAGTHLSKIIVVKTPTPSGIMSFEFQSDIQIFYTPRRIPPAQPYDNLVCVVGRLGGWLFGVVWLVGWRVLGSFWKRLGATGGLRAVLKGHFGSLLGSF